MKRMQPSKKYTVDRQNHKESQKWKTRLGKWGNVERRQRVRETKEREAKWTMEYVNTWIIKLVGYREDVLGGGSPGHVLKWNLHPSMRVCCFQISVTEATICIFVWNDKKLCTLHQVILNSAAMWTKSDPQWLSAAHKFFFKKLILSMFVFPRPR